jgi:hypothetical protein
MQKNHAWFRRHFALKRVSVVTHEITAVNQQVLPAMRERLRLKACSESTIRTYVNEMAQLLHILGNIPADQLKPEDLKRYFFLLL